MRFDDCIDTVLAADMATPFGAQSAWRQLTDLIGRGRASGMPEAIERLRAIRNQVPPPIRAASARGLALAHPPAALVGLFGEDEPSIAAPVLSTARLGDDEWLAMIPGLPPASRALLRHRRDLPAAVTRALDSFGAADFALPHPAAPTPSEIPAITLPAEPANDVGTSAPGGPFVIAELVARLDAYQRDQGDLNRPPRPSLGDLPADSFRFETDATGTIRWVDGVPREPLIGVPLGAGSAQVDGIVLGAFRRRTPFSVARLVVPGTSPAAGDWQLSASPAFEPATGRFTGYRGVARRPRADERATPPFARPAAESLRTLVHELRTPTNAISGFAEMIEAQVLGPAPERYRDQAAAIRRNTRTLLDAIDDVDTAARIEQHALVLRPGTVAVVPLLARIAADLEPLMRLRGAVVAFDPEAGELDVAGDELAVARIVARLLALTVGASGQGERLAVAAARDGAMVAMTIDLPRKFAGRGGDALYLVEGEDEEGAPPLGVGFALRLARNLAAELGGEFAIGEDRLTLRLPAALDRDVGQLSSN